MTLDQIAMSSPVIPSFSSTLASHGLKLTRTEVVCLQVNLGLLCNQTCKHCHLDAGPYRSEIMDMDTFEHVAAFAERFAFKVIDITGGAPELNPHLATFIQRLAGLADRIMIRCNLTCLAQAEFGHLLDVFKKYRVAVVASLPSVNSSQLEGQRGPGSFRKSIETLQRLNSIGFGSSDAGLELDLVVNSTGAFLPPPQDQTEKKFRNDLLRKWGVVFNKLYTFANVPLGRFRSWLEASGNLDAYLAKLALSFNPCTVPSLMCRSLISISWDGFVYDCDFNQAAGIPAGDRKTHVSEIIEPPGPSAPIAVSDHCYACTAGSGFT